jgi:hypothetical protein
MKRKILAVILVSMFAPFALCACADTDKLAKGVFVTETNRDEDFVELTADGADGGAQNADIASVVTYNYYGFVYFGEYPQTVADKDAVKQMSKVTDSTGYYVSASDNEHYAKISSADVHVTDVFDDQTYKFNDESDITDGETYYFKVEPIKWNVYGRLDISTAEIRIYLVSDFILDSRQFCSSYAEDLTTTDWYVKDTTVPANNWAYSSLRTWLNSDSFYGAAFTADEKAKIVARDTTSVNDVCKEGDTTENVYVPTYAEAVTMNDSKAKVSDYGRCRGTFIADSDNYYGNGRWWLCTAGEKTYQAAYVSDNNVVSRTGESVGSTFMGVRPAITISVDSAFEILQEDADSAK